jgi:hypothetical protein
LSLTGLYLGQGGSNAVDSYLYRPGGATPGFRINSQLVVDGNFGVNTITPRRRTDILDASGPQLRLSYSDNVKYGEIWANSSGQLRFLSVWSEYVFFNSDGAHYTTFGIGPTGTLVITPLSGLILFSGCHVANGTVATAMSSLGPAGAHTTIQEWLKILGSDGSTVRYVPCF